MKAKPLPSSFARVPLSLAQSAAVSPPVPKAAAQSSEGELRPIGLALTAIIAGLPVPKDVVRS